MLTKNVLVELFAFAMVGLGAAVTHYLTALVCVEVLTLTVYTGNTAGYLLSVGVSFVGHGLLTFRSRLTGPALTKFLVLVAINYMTAQLILFVTEDLLHLYHRISFGFVVITLPVVSFLLSKFWVFKKTRPQSDIQ